MTKNRIIGAIAALSLLAVPAVAVAHGSGDDRGHDNGRHHSHKHHGKKAKKKSRDVTGSATGTIASFTNGELTITLPSGKSFTADVKRRTVIRCKRVPVVPATVARHGDDDGKGRGGHDDGPNHDAGDDHGNHPTTTAPASTTAPSTTVPAPTGNSEHNHGHGARCGTAALVAGTKVLSAKLKLSDGSATWKKVTLLK